MLRSLHLCRASFCLLLAHLSTWVPWCGSSVPHQLCLCVLYVTIAPCLGILHGAQILLCCVAGAAFQASPHLDFPVFLHLHFTSKSLGPMRSALMCSGKQEPSLIFFFQMWFSPSLHCICPHLLLDLPFFCSSDQFCPTTSSCLCGAMAHGVQWEWAWHIVGIGWHSRTR